MSLILSLETSTRVCSAAVHDAGVLVRSVEHHEPHAHSRVLPQLVRAVLEGVGGSSRLDAVAVSAGPGSYTGLRVGAAFAKGICYGQEIPLIGIDTLSVLAAGVRGYPIPQETLRYTLLDARHGHGYGKVWDATGVVYDTHTCCIGPAIVERFPSRNIFFLGSGAERYHEKLTLPTTSILFGHYPKASEMGAMAWQKLQDGKVAMLERFEPYYLSAMMQETKNPA